MTAKVVPLVVCEIFQSLPLVGSNEREVNTWSRAWQVFEEMGGVKICRKGVTVAVGEQL